MKSFVVSQDLRCYYRAWHV